MQEQDQTKATSEDLKKLLTPMNEVAEMTVNGNADIISGELITVQLGEFQKINGKFVVKSDRHEWTANDYITTLTLEFKGMG